MFARRAASETPTSSLFCGEPLILTEPPGPCGAGRLCVVCGPTGVLCNSVRVRGWIACGPRVFRAPSGPAAREARRPHCVRRRASKPARALRSLRRPPHQWGQVAVVWFGASSGSPARPCRRPRVPQPGPPVPPAPSTPVGPGVLTCGLARRLEARPGPAAAHGYRRLALSTRWVGCLKPSSPLLAGICVGVKPASPLRARNGLICCIFRVQW